MKEDAELAMDCLSNETGVDYKDRIEVVYHLFSYSKRHTAVLKVKLPRDKPERRDARGSVEVGELDGARNFRSDRRDLRRA